MLCTSDSFKKKWTSAHTIMMCFANRNTIQKMYWQCRPLKLSGHFRQDTLPLIWRIYIWNSFFQQTTCKQQSWKTHSSYLDKRTNTHFSVLQPQRLWGRRLLLLPWLYIFYLNLSVWWSEWEHFMIRTPCYSMYPEKGTNSHQYISFKKDELITENRTIHGEHNWEQCPAHHPFV